MRDTINRLARGVFDYEPLVIELSEVNIEESIGINSIYCGEFHVKSVGGQTVKGMVSSSNHGVVMEKATFVGVDNVVKYNVDTRGIRKGEIIEGRFNIVSSGGEQSITYSFKVVDHAAASSMGDIKNLFHFANLVQTEPDEAYKLFASDSFEDTLLKDDDELKNQYELLLYGDKPKYLGTKADVKQCVEELLISTHKKSRIKLSISKTYQDYPKIKDSLTDSVFISKNTWGAVGINISCDNPLVVPETNFVDEEKFAGNRYELRYFIDITKLHPGKNYARITFSSLFETLTFDIVVTGADYVANSNATTLLVQRNIYYLMDTYLSFRVKRINLAQWTKLSLGAIEKIRDVEENDYFYKLIHAQLLISVRKRDEAKWLIENVYEYLMSLSDIEDESALFAYYLYVNSLYQQEPNVAVESLRKIKRMYEEGHDDWKILWVMFYLDEEYSKNKSLKLARIKEQFYKGCTSPMMYLEAALAFVEQPQMIRVLDEFEIQTVLFAVKMGIVTEKLSSHIIEIAENKKTYSKGYYSLLVKLYNKYQDKRLVSSIYKLMIKGETMPKDCFVWIKKAVECDYRITNLYENYLAYCDKTSMEPIPKIILMYFAYNSGLDYNLKAYLYANVYHNRYDDPQTFETYKYQIERFVIDQVSKGHINTNLAKLYKDMLEPSMINADTSKMFASILFSYKITCSNKDMAYVYVKHKETGEVITKPLINGEAYVNIYTQDAGIAVADKNRVRYTGKEMFTVTKLLDGEKYIPLAFKYLQDDLWMLIYFCENGRKYGLSEKEMVDCYKKTIKDSRITDSYRNEITNRIIDYFYREYIGDDFENDYIPIDVEKLDEAGRIKVTETYILNGFYGNAMDIIRRRGAMGVDPRRLLRMCASLIDSVDGEKDAEVLRICEIVFKQNKYDDSVLEYLVKYYDSSTKDMVELWKVARGFDIDTYELEERILYQMMFIGSHSNNMPRLFENYYNHGAATRVVEAYTAYNSYNYFVKEMPADVDVFRVIEHQIKEKINTIDVCKLALLKFYAEDLETIELSDAQIEIAKNLLLEMVDKKKIFSFYKKFASIINVPYDVMDKTMVEYRTNPDTEVLIHYVRENEDGKNEYIVEKMENVFEGIFVKSFVLFYGDGIQYYISEHIGGTEELTESGNLTNLDMRDELMGGRFDIINDMLACVELSDIQSLKRMMNRYVIADKMSEKIFMPL